ncbi:hypothetical protein Poly24_35820 [Rosistilla carotiformis]|uniref:Uncharacterized protein n=1 Tax=Rosistilla carotiformis TaxID=2528017 RepID=A0A518JWF6_9BACT|nr:hypothetical protein [Rosistilla carotiformis]QDV69864.1 hypothetical protein Poly24_35820 [Rosistilla carotiformis]
MYFEDPMPFDCKCGHRGQYPIQDLVSLNSQCSGCGFSLRSLGRSIQQTMNVSHACSKIAVIAVELELQWMIEFDDPELEQLRTVGDFTNLLAAKSTELSPVEALDVVLDKLAAHEADGGDAISVDSPLRELFHVC